MVKKKEWKNSKSGIFFGIFLILAVITWFVSDSGYIPEKYFWPIVVLIFAVLLIADK